MATTFDQALESIEATRRARKDYLIPLKQASLTLDSDGKNIVVVIDGRDYKPNDYALRQMAQWMNVPGAMITKYTDPVFCSRGKEVYKTDRTDMEVLLQVFKNGIRNNRVDCDKMFRFRTYADGTLRAMLTETYAIIDNAWYVEQLQKAFKGMSDQPEFKHFRTNGDTMFGNLFIPGTELKGPDSEYGGMLHCGNSEIGNGRVEIQAAVWRLICTNGMRGWSYDQKWTKVHRGEINLTGLAADIIARIAKTLPILKDGITQLIQSQDRKLEATPSQVIAAIANHSEFGLTRGQTGQATQSLDQFVNHEVGFQNLFGIVNAITRAAQLQKDDAEQFRLEEIGGHLTRLSDARWDVLHRTAKALEKKDVAKVYGVAV